MMTTRDVATKFFTLMASGRFPEAFGMLADDAPYHIVGHTPLSGWYRGPQELIEKLGPALSDLTDLQTTFTELIVDGKRAVALMRASAQAAYGPYVQDPAIFVITVEGDKIVDLLEMVDTVMIETRCFGKKLAAA